MVPWFLRHWLEYIISQSWNNVQRLLASNYCRQLVEAGMGSSSRITGEIGRPQSSSLRRATWRNLNRYFNRIVILLILTGTALLCIIFLHDNNDDSNPPERVTQKQQDEPEETLEYKRNEAFGSHELVRILIRDGGRVAQDDPFLVEHVKTHMLTPPSTLPYNLKTKLNNTSEVGQNIVALGLLQNKTNGFFIECGAWDGEFMSNSLLLEKEFGWTGLLIEAKPDLALQLGQKNRKAWTSSACLSITPYPQVMKFYLGGAISSLINNSTVMNNKYGLHLTAENSVEVLCIPLYTYLLALKVDIVDYLSLDVEAADFAVLRTIPFDKIIFRVLEVEVEWVVEGKEAFRAFLEEKGYVFVRAMWPDYIFVHNSVHNKSLAV